VIPPARSSVQQVDGIGPDSVYSAQYDAKELPPDARDTIGLLSTLGHLIQKRLS